MSDRSVRIKKLIMPWNCPDYIEKKIKQIYLDFNQGENKMRGSQMNSNADVGNCPAITNGPLTGNWTIGIDWATNKHHQVKIDKVTNGFIVEIGCKKFVAEDWKSLAGKLAEYWKDPIAAEKKYAK